jgi:DNA-binding NarL/FixJ family response regulator
MAKTSPAADRVTGLACAVFSEARLFRDLVASWLSVRGGVRVVNRGSRQTDVCAAITRHEPDLLIAGVSHCSDKAVDVIHHFVSTCPQGHVIAVATSGEAFAPPPWLDGNLVAAFDRTTSLNSFWAAIDRLLTKPKGSPTSAIRRRMAGAPLSPQESRILGLIAEGQTSRAIAEQLDISEHTVRAHRKRIIAKLGTAGSNLMRWAVMLRQTGKVPAVELEGV